MAVVVAVVLVVLVVMCLCAYEAMHWYVPVLVLVCQRHSTAGQEPEYMLGHLMLQQRVQSLPPQGPAIHQLPSTAPMSHC